jgi:hypothetical protein
MNTLVRCAFAVLLLGCQSERPAADGVTVAGDTVAEAELSVDSAIDSVPRAARALLALSGDGLMLVNSESGSTRPVSFGTDAATAIAMLSAAVGEVVERGTNEECGAGPVEYLSFGNGLQIVVQKDQFLGWTVRPRADTLRTMSNVGLGTTRAELESVYAAQIAPSTLGMEFMAGGLQGILESGAASARITDLWAGLACVAR